MSPFDQKKAAILRQIENTSEEWPDSSPKGTIDVDIIPLIQLINRHSDMVTTSSCSGRVSVFLEGVKISNNHQKVGGKGQGGRWLFITHDSKDLNSDWWDQVVNHKEEDNEVLQLEALDGRGDTDLPGSSYASLPQYSSTVRYVLYKFESMILHVKCRDSATAGTLYTTAMACGFRESGIGSNNLVAIRTSLRLDAPVAFLDSRKQPASIVPLVSKEYIQTLVAMSLDRFAENLRKIVHLTEQIESDLFKSRETTHIETKDERRARKMKEGLDVQKLLQQARSSEDIELS